MTAPAVYCVVPKLKGLTTSKASAALTKAGCAVGKVSKKQAGKIEEGQGAHPERAGRDLGQVRHARSPSPSGSDSRHSWAALGITTGATPLGLVCEHR